MTQKQQTKKRRTRTKGSIESTQGHLEESGTGKPKNAGSAAPQPAF